MGGLGDMHNGIDRINKISPCEMCKGCPVAWIETQEHLMGKCSIRKDHVHHGSDYYEGRVLCPDFDMSDDGRLDYVQAVKILSKIAIEQVEKDGR